MPRYQVMLLALDVIKLLFVTSVGACVGSLINVLVYRLPLGISVVTPPSRCPSCQTKLTWRENIPIFGWLLLRGRCRFCQVKISPEYPIVEAIVAALFALFFTLWYLVPTQTVWLGIDWGSIRPDWTLNGEGRTWPAFVVLMTLVSSLVAMTIVDAKTTTIPLVLAWVPALAGVIILPLHALWVQIRPPHRLVFHAQGHDWTLPMPGPYDWGLIGACIGAVVGLGLANWLLAKNLIRRSFADYEEWERSVTSQAQAAQSPTGPDASLPPSHPDGSVANVENASPIATMLGLDCGCPDMATSPFATTPAPVEATPAAAAETPGGEAMKLATAVVPDVTTDPAPAAIPESAEAPAQRPEDLWIQYPYARREMVKEILFLAPCLGLGALGMLLARYWTGQQTAWGPNGAQTLAQVDAPLWLRVLGGALLGYLVGGGIVWGTRILGSLAAGREAMGLGDVHLMAAVGACLGWVDAVLAFFGAAFVGLAWQGLGRIFSGVFRRAMPYGPCLAIATLLVLLLRPLIEIGLTKLLHRPIHLP